MSIESSLSLCHLTRRSVSCMISWVKDGSRIPRAKCIDIWEIRGKKGLRMRLADKGNPKGSEGAIMRSIIRLAIRRKLEASVRRAILRGPKISTDTDRVEAPGGISANSLVAAAPAPLA